VFSPKVRLQRINDIMDCQWRRSLRPTQNMPPNDSGLLQLLHQVCCRDNAAGLSRFRFWFLEREFALH
jgi:hypothetical protein